MRYIKQALVVVTLTGLLLGRESKLPAVRPALETPKSPCGQNAKREYLLAYAKARSFESTRELLQYCEEELPVLRARVKLP